MAVLRPPASSHTHTPRRAGRIEGQNVAGKEQGESEALGVAMTSNRVWHPLHTQDPWLKYSQCIGDSQ